MKSEDSVWIDVALLRVGHYVELDVGWMAHPFPTSSFKISTHKQVEVIRGLGREQVRYVPGKSDALPDDAPPETPQDNAQSTAQQALLLAQAREREQRQLRASMLAAQERSLVACERRFAESVRLYRKTMELVQTQPKQAAGPCGAMVTTYVNDMLDKGEASIRLLSEAAGDKSSMHPVNVTIIALLLGKAMGLSRSDLHDLGMAAYLHDIGKVKLPDRVRWMEDSFSSAEFRMYQDHVAEGVTIAKAMELQAPAVVAMQQHHELADGSGFPARLKGDASGVGGRILSLVNRYDNLCNPSRPGSALTPHEALSLIFAQLKSRFDSATLSAFIRMMGVYPPGSVVQLIDDRYAMVVSVNSSRPLKPKVVVHDPAIPKYEALILDLEKAPQLGIRRSLKPVNLPPAALDYLAPRQRIAYFFEQAIEPEWPAEPAA
ncbi:HD-GYP domain-containing protein [Rhodoferax bucti]|uniref:HD-GYP domain-containing protein n=1 Tax=Rhodoferax bucti TaxID=2576305 RepID=UPI0011094114|nr:HD domain-containing phosphohydrolase [Rhodoferax bucti]